jgi:hypothetical protein
VKKVLLFIAFIIEIPFASLHFHGGYTSDPISTS